MSMSQKADLIAKHMSMSQKTDLIVKHMSMSQKADSIYLVLYFTWCKSSIFLFLQCVKWSQTSNKDYMTGALPFNLVMCNSLWFCELAPLCLVFSSMFILQSLILYIYIQGIYIYI